MLPPLRGPVEQARMEMSCPCSSWGGVVSLRWYRDGVGRSGGGQIQPSSPALLLNAWVKASEGGRGWFGSAMENIVCISKTPGGRQPRIPRGTS